MMSWLTDNPVANMYGPHFLLLYGTVIVLTLMACWWMLRRNVESDYFSGASLGTRDKQGNESYGWPIRLAGAAVIVGLGGYKLLAALARGRHNVLFLVAMGLVALCVLFAISPSTSQEMEH